MGVIWLISDGVQSTPNKNPHVIITEITWRIPFGMKHVEHPPMTIDIAAKIKVKTVKNTTALCWAEIRICQLSDNPHEYLITAISNNPMYDES